jgi:hypothetical protein
MAASSQTKYMDDENECPDTYTNRVILAATLVQYLKELDGLAIAIKSLLATYEQGQKPYPLNGGIIRDINEIKDIESQINVNKNKILVIQSETNKIVSQNDVQKALDKRKSWGIIFPTNWEDPSSIHYVTSERINDKFSNIYLYCQSNSDT